MSGSHSRRFVMKRIALHAALAVMLIGPALAAQEPSTDGPYKVLQRARVGGEGGTDYIYADVADRRLYIPRGPTRAVAATDSTPAREAIPGRITAFDLATLKLVGEETNTVGSGAANGAAVDAKSGHLFLSSHPDVSM